MTSREQYEAFYKRRAGSIFRHGIDGSMWDVWQAAVKWASKQAHDAIEEIDDGEAPEYRACQEVIREALS